MALGWLPYGLSDMRRPAIWSVPSVCSCSSLVYERVAIHLARRDHLCSRYCWTVPHAWASSHGPKSCRPGVWTPARTAQKQHAKDQELQKMLTQAFASSSYDYCWILRAHLDPPSHEVLVSATSACVPSYSPSCADDSLGGEMKEQDVKTECVECSYW